MPAHPVLANRHMPKIRVFSTSTCPYCITLKDFLSAKNIAFTDIDVSQNLEAQKEMVEATGQMGVPVINIGDQWVIGFDRQKISQLLDIKD